MTTAAKISIQIDAQTATLQKGFAEARGAIQKLDAGMSGSVAMGMAKFTAGMAVVGAGIATARGMLSSFSQTMNDMGKMDEFAQRLGMSADALTVLGYAAEQSGASQDVMNASLQKMQNLIGEAAAGSKTAAAAFAQLGLKVSDLQKLSADKQFATIAEQIKFVDNNAQRTKIALDLFGKSGGELILVLAGGSAGLNKFGKEAQQMGLLLGDARAQVEAAGDSMNKVYRAWGAVKEKAAVTFATPLKYLAEAVALELSAVNWLIGAGGDSPFKLYAEESKKAALKVQEHFKETAKVVRYTGKWIKEAKADIAKPTDWTTPGVGAVTRGSAAGFSAVQEAQRANKDDERRHRDIVAWLARIEAATKKSTITLAPVNF